MENLTIRSFSKMTGVSSKTLRYWESIGLLPRPGRSHTGYRIYLKRDQERVLFIRKAKSLGFSLSEIKRIFEVCRERGEPCESVLRWAERKIRMLDAQIRALSDLRSRLERHSRQWKKRKGSHPVPEAQICCCIEEVSLEEGGEKNEA